MGAGAGPGPGVGAGACASPAAGAYMGRSLFHKMNRGISICAQSFCAYLCSSDRILYYETHPVVKVLHFI